MKSLIARMLKTALALFLTSMFFTGLTVSGGFINFIIAGALLAVLSVILDPIIKIVTLPFNILTLGFLSFLTTLVALYITTMFLPYVSVKAFVFQGVSFLGLTIGVIHFSNLLSFVVISATIYFLGRLINFLFDTK